MFPNGNVTVVSKLLTRFWTSCDKKPKYNEQIVEFNAEIQSSSVLETLNKPSFIDIFKNKKK